MAKCRIELPEPGILSELLSFLFPVRCVHCGRAGNWLCPRCAAGLSRIERLRCRRCGRPAAAPAEIIAPGRAEAATKPGAAGCSECRSHESSFHQARAAFHFEGPARSLVHRLKYSGQRRLAGFMAELSAPAAAGFLADLSLQLRRDSPVPAADCLTATSREVTLTYVPLHGSKQVSRGYNQSEMYARALARHLGLPHRSLLYKRQPTLPQNQLDFSDRRNNLIGSFDIRRGASIVGERVILVDDVYTTGATARECARILKEGLGVQVHVWTFARTVRRANASIGSRKVIRET